MTVADLADLLGMGDWHQAARLIDPKRSTKLTTLMSALDALGCQVKIAINDDFVPEDVRDLLRDTGFRLAERQSSPRAPELIPPARSRTTTPN